MMQKDVYRKHQFKEIVDLLEQKKDEEKTGWNKKNICFALFTRVIMCNTRKLPDVKCETFQEQTEL